MLGASNDQVCDLITSLNVTKNRIDVYVNKEFASIYLRQDFFVEYEDTIDLCNLNYSIVTIPFIMNVIPMVWVSGNRYHIDSMDEDLYYSLQEIKEVFKTFYPSISWEGELVPRMLVKNSSVSSVGACDRIAVLFSGGLDAVCTSFRYFDKSQLLITICGSDIPVGNKVMWQYVQEHCKNFAQCYNHKNAFIRSNFVSFFNNNRLCKLTPEIYAWWSRTLQGLGYTGLTAPLLVSHGYRLLFIGATRTKEMPEPYGTHPVIDNAIMFAGVKIYHDGSELDRLQKVDAIVEVCEKRGVSKPVLRVCWGHDVQGGNCCNCEKCLRTINELIVQGQDPREYGFNISISDLIQKTKEFFNEVPCFCASGLLWHWRCIQRQILKKLSSDFCNLNGVLCSYLQWLLNKNFAQVHDIYTAEQKNQFALLWEQKSYDCKFNFDC